MLVRTNAQARTIKAALDAAGVPAVLNTATSVFATDAARDWLALLEALERPEYLPRAKAAALTKFLNWTAAEVAGAGDGDWDDVQARLHEWAGLLRRTGVATLMEDITQRERLPERLLGVTGGERVLTDLRHVAELLHGAAIDGRLGITALASWLRHRMAADDREAGSEERARRLESDAAAVQVLTVHRSKGLEFGVVHCPFLWDPFRGRDRGEAPAIYHDAARGNERTLDVSLETRDAAFVEHADAGGGRAGGEELRLAYVALTRAKHQAVVWWATSWTCRDSPLGRLVFERDFGPDVGEAPPARTDANTVATSAAARFRALAALAPDAIALERALVEKVPPREAVAGEAVAPDDLGVAVFDRDARRALAAGVVLGDHRGRLRGAGGERGRGGGRRRRRGGRARAACADAGAAPARRAARTSRWRRCPRGRGSARSSTRSWRRRTSRRPTSAPSWATQVAGGAAALDDRRGRPHHVGRRPRRARSRRRSGPRPATCGCATCGAPTASTS